jgi:lysozyme
MTTAIEIASPRLQVDEGFRAHQYLDTEGNPTIGYGWNISAGITQYCALALLDAQLEELHAELVKFSWYAGLDPVRQSVPLEIAFNAGLHGLLGYPHMISALSIHDWTGAATHCTTNNPRLKNRYETLSRILVTGDA